MLALRYHAIGDLTGLRLDEVPVPAAAAAEILVRVRAASVNPVDWKIAGGRFRPLVRGGVPRTMGSDFAGEVAALGPGVVQFAVGERVFGFIDPFVRTGGTFADFVTVPVESAYRLPEYLEFQDGAALACVGLTAVVLCDLGRVGAGSKVLVNGAAGGVGHVTVQVAVARGATVTATASAAKHEFVRALGASTCIDYRAVPMAQWPRGFDAVLDCVPNMARSLQGQLLRRNGHYVTTVPDAATFLLDPVRNCFGGVQRHGVMLRPNPAAAAEVLAYVERGRLRCSIEHQYPLASALEAIKRSQSGRVQGKIVLRIS